MRCGPAGAHGGRDAGEDFAVRLYKSTDYGKTFKSIAGNLPPRDRVLVIATHGRGVCTIAVSGVSPTLLRGGR